MSKITSSDRVATRDEVVAHRDELRRLGRAHGLTWLRLTDDGVLVVHSDDPGYRQVIRFSVAAADTVGAHVRVITDDVPAARAATAEL